MTSLFRARPVRMRAARLLVGMVLLAVLAACTTGPRVRTDLDPRANFAQYTTFAFYKPLTMESAGYSTYLTDSIKASIRQQMEARGYRYDELAPGLRVNFQGVVQEKVDVFNAAGGNFGFGYGGYGRYGYGWGGRGGWGGGPFWYDQPRVYQYREGILTIDLVDSSVNHLVWSGVASSRVTGQKSPQDRAAEVDRAVASVFAQFPFNAGSAQGNLAPAR